MPRSISPSLVTLALSAAALIGYAGYRAWVHAPDVGVAAVGGDADTAPPVLADTLPDFALDDLEGKPTPISSWPGKPLIVNFWATWCAPCLREIPLLKQFQTDNPSIQIVGIAIDRVEPVRAFAEDMAFNYPVLVGPQAMDAAGAFGVDFVAMPFTVFAGADGSVLGVHTGELHEEHLIELATVLDELDAGTIDRAIARARLAGRM